MSKKWNTVLATALLVATTAGAANAEVILAGNKDDAKSWRFSTDGFVNAFYVYEDAEAKPAGTVGGIIAAGKSSTIRTGLLPGLIAFTAKAPTTNGIDISARVGFYPQIQNGDNAAFAGSRRTNFDSQVDTRELWLAADGKFGQVLAGKALNLFQGKSILTDMTLFGVGSTGGPASGGTTLGHIGTGYLYAQFGPNMRYTSPDLGGLKIAVSITDPSIISGDVTANVRETPGVEGEITYARKFNAVSTNFWVNGTYQKAKFAAPSTMSEVTAAGVSGGAQVAVAGAEFTASGFTGKGLGSLLLFDLDSLDSAGEERKSSGFLVQGTYKIASTDTKLGVNYGVNTMDETAADRAIRVAGNGARLDNASSLTLGVYQNITPSWQVMAEYTRTNNEWFNNADQKSDVFAFGTFFFF